ncbi:MAG: phytoene desaturase family protein, partial [Nocardioidaceae bacterium]
EYTAWQQFYGEVGDVARAVAPSLLDPLPAAGDLRARTAGSIWSELVEEPLGRAIEDRFADDLVRGVVATDALIGTFASMDEPSLIQNRCFLYHLIGNGTGEWCVPVGGMGAVTAELLRAATAAGAVVRTGHEVTAIAADASGAQVTGTTTTSGGEFAVDSDWVLCGAAPAVLDRLLGRDAGHLPRGAQLKLNLLVDRLPRLRSGVDPATAFNGTLHLAESYSEIARAHAEAESGSLPSHQPGEIYCHTLTDPSILGAELAASGAHTLTYFGLHTPPDVFAGDHEARTREAVTRALAELDRHLVEPIEDCLTLDADGRPCLEAKTPLDIEEALAMPGGHIFHGDLSWPWLASDEEPATPAEAWGVATTHPRVLLCGSGARRGGAVSGIAGHNAAHAVLDFAR